MLNPSAQIGDIQCGCGHPLLVIAGPCVIESRDLVFEIAEKLKISVDEARKASKDLMTFGAFIDISETEFEAMHPRFTVVNMYRKMCERENIEFKRNKVVDGIGVILEKPYDDARTK